MSSQSEAQPKKLRDWKFFLILLPIPTALYIGILAFCGAPLVTTWFVFLPDATATKMAIDPGYNRWLDIVFGPVIAYAVTVTWRHLFNDNTLTGFGMIFVIGGAVASLVTLIAFLIAGAVAAFFIGPVWFVGVTVGISVVTLLCITSYKFYQAVHPWLYR